MRTSRARHRALLGALVGVLLLSGARSWMPAGAAQGSGRLEPPATFDAGVAPNILAATRLGSFDSLARQGPSPVEPLQRIGQPPVLGVAQETEDAERQNGGQPAGDQAPTAAAPGPERATVQDTRGQGALLREQPALLSPVLRVLREGAEVTIVGPDTENEGLTWRNVKDDDGTVGWIIGELLRKEEKPIPVVAVSAPAGGPRAHPQIDSPLMPAWSLLTAIQQRKLGQSFKEIVDRTKVKIVVGPLPQGALGLYQPRENRITIHRDLLVEDPRVVASVLAHEIAHAKQVKDGLGRKRGDCIYMEVEATMMNIAVWAIFWPENAPNRTQAERQLNREVQIMATEGEPGIYMLIVSEEGYQAQCRLIVPTEES